MFQGMQVRKPNKHPCPWSRSLAEVWGGPKPRGWPWGGLHPPIEGHGSRDQTQLRGAVYPQPRLGSTNANSPQVGI